MQEQYTLRAAIQRDWLRARQQFHAMSSGFMALPAPRAKHPAGNGQRRNCGQAA